AHGMLPHLGAGVGQGMEDVFTLTQLLAHPQTNKSNIDVTEGSNRAGKVYDNYGPGQLDTSMVAERLTGQWEPVWNHDVRDEVAFCVQMLSDESVFEV
ncbi:hypothetical protein MPER_07857, partial [Moniliophthora perniciosa FA553]